MLQQGITGVVKLEVIVAPDGTPKEITVVESPHDSLTKAATETLKKWEFPPLPSDKPQTDRHYLIPFKFEVRSSEPSPAP